MFNFVHLYTECKVLVVDSVGLVQSGCARLKFNLFLCLKLKTCFFNQRRTRAKKIQVQLEYFSSKTARSLSNSSKYVVSDVVFINFLFKAKVYNFPYPLTFLDKHFPLPNYLRKLRSIQFYFHSFFHTYFSLRFLAKMKKVSFAIFDDYITLY